jgi:hypothetical protein
VASSGPDAVRPALAKVAAARAPAIGNARPAAAVQEPAVGNRAIAELASGEAGLSQAWRSVIQRFAAERKPPDPFDMFGAFMREEAKRAAQRPPAPPPPAPTVPGDLAQQARVFRLRAWEVFERPDISAAIEQLSDQLTASTPAWHRQRPGPWDTPADMWREEFEESLTYILTQRTSRRDPVTKADITIRTLFRRRLEIAEAGLMAKFQGDELVSQVEALRARFHDEWEATVDLAARRFVQLATNDADLLGTPHRPKGAFVLGLPAGMEPTRTSADAPKQVEKGAVPVAKSVVTFMAALQAESNDAAVAENYKDHELANPHVATAAIGHYSFDIHPTIAEDPDTGFYQHALVVAYFMAMERAAKATNIEWMAFYNDAAVVKEVNDALGVGHVAFSGGGGHGQYHHGPAPFILHIHVNIMPKDLEAKYRVGKKLEDLVRIVDQYLGAMRALF